MVSECRLDGVIETMEFMNLTDQIAQGLLMDILNIFHKNHVSVQSAKISTYGEKIFDIFQITDIKNNKIKDADLIKSLEEQLIKVL